MEHVITTSGKRVRTDMVSSIPYPQMLYIRVVDMSLSDVAALFSNPSEVQELTYGNQKLHGYTLDALIIEGDAIRVNMRRA